ncbi:MAG TPA: ferredoxin [Nocardioides sp.]|uniref:ferredoxin n=1 Tax=uncultured Nocardioides sp. TaxID=198441 RepID=UPI002620E296|nr:ferredoxin [uncultured Nocardioides sp.]HRI94045.1 ferredoxin [Nocardioides sp.]HRK44047.1 ferredoxin [Nocardioides sp.]
MHVEVDQEACCGTGLCVVVAPDVFGQREDDGVVTLLLSSPPLSRHADVIEAAASCPANVIQVIAE